ncbi:MULTISPECIES: preprotein translocase subunit SecG [unclassified Methylobacterium]|uniref:preprotein translocase subunit SecG n=1 Tax=unclassified Methylobacterium TaxID=2615210 RepID=UPI0006F899FF|nr:MULTISPECIES: preprotein translocase subunit SecG [unclassified Methylobacterium]KQO71153.1 preprotein translocase subunit SecG [Methylobacterium sp. Leaf89]KQO79338.1 preprotein translocase subunit SecG [Methylobacterium sp. Leaf88]KQP76416.1 preprotein translocase subunit SecG [Methylobacterium sp. Leaf111]KQT70839.1 preprotein translocase subunit SecG [Methylobacterium sp. Leaf465]
MQTVLISIHLIVVLGLIAVVLLQRSEGGLGLGGGGSGGVAGFMTGRGQANALTRATAILAALFFTTSMALAILSHRSAAPRSILEGTGTSQPATQPNAGNLLDTLRGQSGTQPGTPASGTSAPGTPAQVPETAPAQPAVPQAPQSR